jgi:mannose-6-phosphate isomerase-like protein (cupin superfamily)
MRAMPRLVTNVRQFTADRAWGARDVAEIEGASVRLHWTDQPYKWHVNDGAEVFLVLDGEVDMHWREDGVEQHARLGPADMFVADVGDEHVAHPIGAARILVIEKKGSV